MESKHSLTGRCLTKTENVSAHSDQKVNLYLSFYLFLYYRIVNNWPTRRHCGYRTNRNTRGWTLSCHLAVPLSFTFIYCRVGVANILKMFAKTTVPDV